MSFVIYNFSVYIHSASSHATFHSSTLAFFQNCWVSVPADSRLNLNGRRNNSNEAFCLNFHLSKSVCHGAHEALHAMRQQDCPWGWRYIHFSYTPQSGSVNAYPFAAFSLSCTLSNVFLPPYIDNICNFALGIKKRSFFRLKSRWLCYVPRTNGLRNKMSSQILANIDSLTAQQRI